MLFIFFVIFFYFFLFSSIFFYHFIFLFSLELSLYFVDLSLELIPIYFPVCILSNSSFLSSL
ncbi:hypothetical protein BJ944DRAFT_270970 [Cunninghamella echinulata]|nr:hypothetical protein BJ944DRAFT_270970 [Cunninghamella echinulata]